MERGNYVSSNLRKAVIKLTDDQIKSLFTAPVTILPTPGDGKFTFVAFIILAANLEVGYTISDDMPLDIKWGSESAEVGSANFLLGDDGRTITGGSNIIVYAEEGDDIVISSNEDFEDGDPANTFTITIFYEEIDL